MKKTLMVFACTALLAASLSACGSKPAENTDTGTASSAAASSSSSEQQQENTLTGSLDEKKNGMFVVTDAEGAAYEFTYDPSDTPKGLDDAAEGDSVTVTYTGTVSEVDSFDGTVVSVEKERKKSPAGDRFSVSPAGDFAFQDFCSALSRYIR